LDSADRKTVFDSRLMRHILLILMRVFLSFVALLKVLLHDVYALYVRVDQIHAVIIHRCVPLAFVQKQNKLQALRRLNLSNYDFVYYEYLP